jgi:lipoprotein NlpI
LIRPNLVLAQSDRRYFYHAPHRLTHLVALCCLAVGLSASGQTGDENEKSCADPTENSDLRISACTALIQSAQTSTDDLAAAYNDRGNGYKSKGDYDRAIQDYGEAIRLKPDFALAFYNRGNSYDSQGEYDRAIQDLDQAIRLKPDDGNDDANVFYARGYAYNAKGDYDRAIQDYDQAIRLKPDYANAFIVRGIANFLRANLAGAVTDFQRGNELNPANAYDVLWLYLARKRLGRDDAKDLTRRSAEADPPQWPGPILRLYMGQITAGQLMAAIASSDAYTQKRQLCEANFFAGEDALLHRRRAAAKALLQAASDGCPKTNLHYDAAAAELRRLNAITTPTKSAAPAK